MLLSDRRHMISGRGFIGIAAQSLGTGRPVLPRSWLPCCPASSPNRGADAGRYAEKTRQIHTSPVPRMRPLAPEAKRTPQALPAGFRSVVILRTCVAQSQIADGGSGCGREVRPTGHHAPGVDGPGEDALQHGLELLVAADRQRTAVAGHEVDVVALAAGDLSLIHI